MILIVSCHQFYSLSLLTQVPSEQEDNEEPEVARIKGDGINLETSSKDDEYSNDEHQEITIELKEKIDKIIMKNKYNNNITCSVAPVHHQTHTGGLNQFAC